MLNDHNNWKCIWDSWHNIYVSDIMSVISKELIYNTKIYQLSLVIWTSLHVSSKEFSLWSITVLIYIRNNKSIETVFGSTPMKWKNYSISCVIWLLLFFLGIHLVEYLTIDYWEKGKTITDKNLSSLACH